MIRTAGPDDIEVVKQLRLAMLACAPEAYGTTYEQAAALSDEVWFERLTSTNQAVFIGEVAGDAAGMVVAFRPDRSAPVLLVSMWVAPLGRGSGLADGLVSAVIEWAAARNADRVCLGVTAGNHRAERLYARHGFERTGHEQPRERDGLVEIEMERLLR